MSKEREMGRMMGIEPTYTGTTNRGLDRLATPAIPFLLCESYFNQTLARISSLIFETVLQSVCPECFQTPSCAIIKLI
jgi:hypothetical protein